MSNPRKAMDWYNGSVQQRARLRRSIVKPMSIDRCKVACPQCTQTSSATGARHAPCMSNPLLALPCRTSCPINFMQASILSRARYLVIRSAGFSVPNTLRYCAPSLSWISWIHKALTLMCLHLPAPFLLAMANAADESAYRVALSS